jgi:hypothetical protein
MTTCQNNQRKYREDERDGEGLLLTLPRSAGSENAGARDELVSLRVRDDESSREED